MDSSTTPDAGLTLTLPAAGLREILRAYSGEGTIYEDLAAAGSAEPIQWTASDIRRRARRVLLALLEPICETLPATSNQWASYLPAASVVDHLASARPASGVNWLKTARTYGWPPSTFARRDRHRDVDEVTLQILAWLALQLEEVHRDVRSEAPTSSAWIAQKITALSQVVSRWPDLQPARPDRLELNALAASGYPWSAVASAARLLHRAAHDPEFIALDLIAPDLQVGGRLFHLATSGLVIRALTNHRFHTSWMRPISGSRPGPQIEAIGPLGTHYHLWFEAAGARKSYGMPASPYVDAVRGIPGAGGAIGVDVMLLQRGASARALLLECKWSPKPSYVGRDGYHQAASYALDTVGGLASDVWSFVVGPQEVVTDTGVSLALHSQLGVILGSTSPLHLGDVISSFLADDPASLV